MTHPSRRVEPTDRRPRSRKVGLGALLLVVVATAFPAVLPPAASAGSGSGTGTSTITPRTYENRVQRWVNVMRANHGLPRLRVARCTDRSAERWTRHLAANDLFYHQSMERLLERCNARYAGETLGRGAIAPRVLVSMWMDSQPHRVVLLSPSAHRIGVGAKRDLYGRWVTTANFMRF